MIRCMPTWRRILCCHRFRRRVEFYCPTMRPPTDRPEVLWEPLADCGRIWVMRTRLNYKRAVGIFIAAYVAVTVLGIALSLAIGMVGHMPQSAEPLQNQAYLVAERFYPLLNLLVWGMLAGFIFGGERRPIGWPCAERRLRWASFGWSPRLSSIMSASC